MLAQFVIQLLTFCALLLLIGWVVELWFRRGPWPVAKDEVEPYGSDVWFVRHLHQ